MVGRIKVGKKKEKKKPRQATGVELGNQFIRKREQRTSRLAEQTGQTVRGARRQVSKEIAGEEQRDTEKAAALKRGEPESIAQRGLDIERAEQIILQEERLQKEGTLPVEDVEDEGKIGRKTLRERLEESRAEAGEGGTTIKELLLGPEDIDVRGGTLPIGPAGSILNTATKAGGLIGKQAKLNQLFKGSSNTQILSKVKLKEAYKLNNKQADAVIKRYNSFTTKQITEELTKTSKLFNPKVLKTLGAVAGTIAGADTIFAWYALDNISDGLLFQARNLEKSLRNGSVSPEEAEELFRESDIAYDLALKKIDQSARFNPLTFGSRKLIVKGAQIKKQEYELIKRSLGL